MAADKVDPCTIITRPKANMVVNNEVIEKIGSEYRTLPIFEKGLFEYTYTKHYSLRNNEYLKCQWKKYQEELETRVYAPFQFLDIRDYHFYNCRNRLIPSMSVHTRTDHRLKLKPGPGVDDLGELPIPQELHMTRGSKGKDMKSKRKKLDDGGKTDPAA